MNQIFILIPAYNPDNKLFSLVRELMSEGFSVILVNDGSEIGCDVFEQLSDFPGCHIIHHAINLGKGRALKTGFNYFYVNFPEAMGVVTADADGQHLSSDIKKIALTLLEDSSKFIIGSRKFLKDIPIRSLIGNILTKWIFFFLIGKKISDTQSGLRGIGRRLIPALIGLKGERYEYEINQLILTKNMGIDIREVEIETIYIQDNKSSHFNPLIDSMRIYFLLFRFLLSGIFASVVDLIIFVAIYSASSSLLTSMVVARLCSSVINFALNKNIVFHNTSKITNVILLYYLNVVVSGGLAYILIDMANSALDFAVVPAKVIIEALLFLLNFVIQREFIFINKRSEVYPD